MRVVVGDFVSAPFDAIEGNRIAFSRDGRRFGYTGRRGGGYVVALAIGAEQPIRILGEPPRSSSPMASAPLIWRNADAGWRLWSTARVGRSTSPSTGRLPSAVTAGTGRASRARHPTAGSSWMVNRARPSISKSSFRQLSGFPRRCDERRRRDPPRMGGRRSGARLDQR